MNKETRIVVFFNLLKTWLFLLLNSLIVFACIGSFLYLRFYLERHPTSIPSETAPWLYLCFYIGILSIFLLTALLPPIFAEYLKKNTTKPEIKPVAEAEPAGEPKPVVEPKTIVPTGISDKIIQYLLLLIQILPYPFVVFYFSVIKKIPFLHWLIENFWFKILLRLNVRFLSILLYFIPSLLILLALTYDIFVNCQIYYFYLAARMIIIILIWKIFLAISTDMIKSSLYFAEEVGAIEIHLIDFSSFSLDKIKELSLSECFTFIKIEPKLEDPAEIIYFNSLATASVRYVTNLMKTLLILGILEKQIHHDSFFQPFLLFLKYGYIYIWSVIVITYILRM